jgi:L-ribulose-5-phosphate 4-epimerase
MLEALKTEVCRLNRELPRNGLVVWTGGNVSARDPRSGLVVIKPSGMKFEDLRPKDQVVLDLNGKVVEGRRTPSSDAASHLYVYRHRPEVRGIAHTHSTFATVFAALGRPIPCFLTAMADEFGGPVPCAGFALIGGEEIGREIVKHLGRSPAVLLRNHGLFAVGGSGEAAVKAAVMAEDAARTSYFALLLDRPKALKARDIARLHHRYTNVYGQRLGR